MNSPVMQGLQLNTPAYVKHARLIAWVADMVALCKPDQVYWCDGSDAEYDRLAQALVDAGCRYIHIDEPGYTAYVDPTSLEGFLDLALGRFLDLCDELLPMPVPEAVGAVVP